jgi:tetratricopeptide (TPR) repeat protein
MRLAIVATPSPRADLRPAPGALDGDLVRARLSLEDAAFVIVDVDPQVDLAEQLDAVFDEHALGEADEVLFYVAAPVVVSPEGELFVCLDTSQPDTGDALSDVAAVFVDRARGPVLFVLECRHVDADADPFRSATVVASARKAVSPASTGIAVLVAARPLDHEGEQPSPLTRALVSAIDGADPARGLSAHGFYDDLQESEALLGVVPCFAFAEGKRPFALVAGPDVATRRSRPHDEENDDDENDDERDASSDGDDGEPDVDEEPATSTEADDEPEVDEEPESPEAEADEELAIDEELEALPAPVPVIALAPLPVPIVPPESAPEPASTDEPPPSRASSMPPIALSAAVSFQRSEPPLPKVILSDRPPPVVEATSASTPAAERPSAPPPPPVAVKRSSAPPPPPAAKRSSAPPPAPASAPPARSSKPTSIPPSRGTAEHVVRADELSKAGELDAALSELKKALVLVGTAEARERAEIYARIGDVKRKQGRVREAISNFEKVVQLVPSHREAQLVLMDLSVAEKDFRGVQMAEERLLASLDDPDERFQRLVEFGTRWMHVAQDPAKARACFEKARELRPKDLLVLGKLRDVHEATRSEQEALAMRREIAHLTPDARARAKQFFDLGRHHQTELKREDAALELYDLALESDPAMLEPLELVAAVLAERQEWSELEAAYRRMLERSSRIAEASIRREVSWELCRRLGLLFRDHLEDPHLALDAFEDSLEQKPEDLGGHLVAADLARSIGELERAASHLQLAAELDPTRLVTFHDLFEVFQRVRRPDQAYAAAAVTTHLRNADTRERFVFEEHAPAGVPKLQRPLADEEWEAMRPRERDRDVEAILAVVSRSAIAAKIAQLAAEERLPALDPASRQDLERSTVSVTRSFVWASHFLGIDPPAVYVREDAPIGVAAVPGEAPSVLIGSGALRGRSLPDLAFLVGRQLAYFAGTNELLLYFPSIDELSACFLAAVTLVRPALPLPASVREPTVALREALARRMPAVDRKALEAAVTAFEANGARADLAAWAAAVERTATRAGYVLAGDLGVVATLLRAEPRSVLTAEQKIADLLGFAVSDEHHAIREALGVAIEP